jgi:hypothetical protein
MLQVRKAGMFSKSEQTILGQWHLLNNSRLRICFYPE